MVGFRSIDWSRLGIEAIVIIVSVLAALALDDWRDARAGREVEQYLLVSLHGHLTADREELEDSLECFWIAGLSKPESGLIFANRV